MKVVYDPEVDVLSVLLSDASIAESDQALSLRQEQEWLTEQLMNVAAAARKIQAIIQQTDLTGSYLDGDLSEGSDVDELGEMARAVSAENT